MKAKTRMHDEAGRELFQVPKKYCWVFPALPIVAAKHGKVAAMIALCLFSFGTYAQNETRISAPTYVVFNFGRDTVDSGAMPAFFEMLGADSSAAVILTATSIAYLQAKPKDVNGLNAIWENALQGVGLKHYVWFRAFAQNIEDTRLEWSGEKHR